MEDNIQTELTDWIRLHKALAVEAERGFTDLVGKQYRFSEFLCLSFGKPPVTLPAEERSRWQEMAAQFASYPELTLEERQHLVAAARRYLHICQKRELGEQGEQGEQREQGMQGERTEQEETRSLLLTLNAFNKLWMMILTFLVGWRFCLN